MEQWLQEKLHMFEHVLNIPDDVNITKDAVILTEEQRVGFKAGIQFVLDELLDESTKL